jgi:hypothetical protein
MKGPMKGATIGHAKQRIHAGRYIGLTEPGIVAAEPPNAIVNQLAILPDIEKRLEAFVRLGHGIVVFPGGAGTAEEILYLVGILLDPKNEPQPFPVVFTGPRGSEEYFRQIDAFLAVTLGERVRQCYRIIVDDPAEVAREMLRGMHQVREYRRRYRVGFLVHDGTGNDSVPPSNLELTRETTFQDAQVLAKEAEEELLFRDMQSDMVQQILHRLAAARKPA